MHLDKFDLTDVGFKGSPPNSKALKINLNFLHRSSGTFETGRYATEIQ
jgi:hypothetical protein